jgi:hypothetical protein
VKGRFSGIKWVWDAQVSGSGKFAGLSGSSRGLKSRNGAVEHAVKDFEKKALASGIGACDLKNK